MSRHVPVPSLGPREHELHQLVISTLQEQETVTVKIDVHASKHGGMYGSPFAWPSATDSSDIADSTNPTDTTNPTEQSPTIVIDMAKYTEPPHLDLEQSIVTVSAGAMLEDVRAFLERYSLCLHGTPESRYISVGGTVLFSAHHGSSLWHSLSEYVVDMTLINGHGALVTLSDPKLFVNYGLLGIVFRIRLRVFPARNVLWRHRSLTLMDDDDDDGWEEDSTRNYANYIYSNLHDSASGDTQHPCVAVYYALQQLVKQPPEPGLHSIVFGPYTHQAIRTDIEFTDETRTPGVLTRWKRAVWDAAMSPMETRWGSKLVKGMLGEVPAIGVLASELFLYEPDRVQLGTRYFEPAPSFALFTIEHALDRQQLPMAYKHVMTLIDRHTHGRPSRTYVLRFWARFQAAVHDCPTNLAFGRDTVLVEVTIDKQQPLALELAEEIIAAFQRLGGRPHLGKTVLTPEELDTYDLSLLREAVQTHDPRGVFQHGWLQEVFDTVTATPA